ncbi:epoxide hydrolase, soluble (sEH), partial [Spiromyces aspiralis]
VNHDDLIHDIAYNFYGTRFATCGSDQLIKVWDYNKETGMWAHDSSVLCLNWAHPEFGEILASSSFDRSVKIWVEQKNGKYEVGVASSDGTVRFYTPYDNISLQNWVVSSQINATLGGSKDSDGPMVLTWCPARFAQAPMVAIGCSRENKVKIYKQLKNEWSLLLEVAQYDSNILTLQWAPHMGRSYHMIGVGCSDGYIRIYHLWLDLYSGKRTIETEEDLFAYEEEEGLRQIDSEMTAEPISGRAKGTTESGAQKDNTVSVHDRMRDFKPNSELKAEWAAHSGLPVRKVKWNATGTQLVSSGDDGYARTWRMAANGEWRCMLAIAPEGADKNA